MAEPRSKARLGRLLRVRTLQLGQVQAQEAAANERLDSETGLRTRIAQLADNVAPRTADTGPAATLAAAAYYRDRLHTSAAAADTRVSQAEAGLARARAATREARRDQSAIEKLIARAEAEATVREMRKLEEAPPSGKNRHAIC
jgi:flagellar protein FliJ